MRKRMTLNEKNESKVLKDGYKEFLITCKVKNLSAQTIKFYSEGYELFTKMYDESLLICNITKKTIDDYILFIRENTQMNNVSVNTRLKAIRTILYYFMKHNYLERFNIELVKVTKSIKETYSDTELEILLVKPNIKTCNFAEYRTWTIINYLLGTGNRASTVTNIKIRDIDFINACILLTKTKNRNQQIIPLSNSLLKVLTEYLEYRKGDLSDYLFSSSYSCQLTLNALENSIRKYNLKRGVTKTSVHLFRHTFAKKWIMGGGDVFRLQKLLGHSSMDMVRNYVNMFSTDLQKDFNEFNPLEQMSKSRKNYIKTR